MSAQTQLAAWSVSTSAQRLLNEAPYLPRCSDNKTAAIVRPVLYAIRYPYMQVNRSGMVSWMVFDLDHSNANIWDDCGLPAPNLIVRNRKTVMRISTMRSFLYALLKMPVASRFIT